MTETCTRRVILSAVLILLAALIAEAQVPTAGGLTGTVKDTQGAGIPGAEIIAKNIQTKSEFKAVADNAGVWKIQFVPTGNYTIRITTQGFIDAIFNEIQVDSERAVIVDATMQLGFMYDIVVTASRFAEEVINAPATATVIPERIISNSPFQNVPDLLRTVPGMNLIRKSAAAYGATSRSATSTRAGVQLVLVDGRTFYNDAFGFMNWLGLPTGLDDIKQVEVIRGPASAVWGSNAMNGAINIITKPAREMIGTTLALGVGTFDRSGGAAETNRGFLYYGSATHAQALNDRWAFKISGGGLINDAFARPQGTLPNEFHTPYPAFTNKGATQPKVDGRVDYDMADRKQHFTFAGGYASSRGNLGENDGDLTASYGKLDYSRDSLRISGYINDFILDGRSLTLVAPSGQPVRMDIRSTAYHVEFADFRALAGKHLISYGGSFRHARFNDSLAPPYKSRNEGGGYLQGEMLLSKRLRWVVGARIDKFDSLKGVVTSPRTTFMVKPAQDQTLRISYGRAYVAPSIYYTDMRADVLSTFDLGLINPLLAGKHFAFSFSSVGNRNLEERSLNAYEIGYSAMLANGRGNLGAAFYINDDKGDFYTLQIASYTSQNPPPGWPLPPSVLDALITANAFGPGSGLPLLFQTENRGKVRNKGLELSADARFTPQISAFANYSWQARPESKDFNVFSINLPPAHRFNAGIHVDFSRYLGNVSIEHVGSAYWNDTISIQYSGRTKSYTVVNTTAGVRWGENRRYAAMLKISNLGNMLVQNHVLGDILKRQIAVELKMRY
jgi:outer membrane receptor protein involved in Fe transport